MRAGINLENKSEKKQYLGCYNDVINNIRCIDVKINVIRGEMDVIDDDDDLRRYLDYLIAQKKSLEAVAKNARKKILASIYEIDDYTTAQVLSDIYIKGMTIDDTAADVGYSVRHTYRILSRGIDSIAMG